MQVFTFLNLTIFRYRHRWILTLYDSFFMILRILNMIFSLYILCKILTLMKKKKEKTLMFTIEPSVPLIESKL